MHNHVTSRDDLTLLLANGVTTMLNMGEATNAFAGRTRIAVNKGAVPGPHIFTALAVDGDPQYRSEEHTSELQSLMRISYAVFCLKKKKKNYTSKYSKY